VQNLGKYRVFCKGAAEQVLAVCVKRLKADGTTEEMKPGSQAQKDIEDKIKDYAGKALRTIVLAYKVPYF
jgi:magnesium-transporting ATPase (P-type)